MWFISDENFKTFADEISKEYTLYFPVLKETRYNWKKYQKDDEISLDGFRTDLPAKYFFYATQEELRQKEKIPFAVLGMRACDLEGLKLLKKIYLDEPRDPYFRDENLIITADCTDCGENCFCTVLGKKPYAEDGFDLNFSRTDGGFFVQTGTQKGNALIEKLKELFIKATEEHKYSVSRRREEILKKVSEKNNNQEIVLKELGEKIEKNREVFEEFSKTCVSCSACTNICPACFCFFLSEGAKGKIRYADSCQFKGYARVAGGANPRKELVPRFKHRFLCKFSFRPQMQEYTGCTGCGRCIDGCQGKIDFKEVILKVYET